MEPHRDVIVDLLPVYLAGEASAETRKLVEGRIASDRELARLLETGRADLASMTPPRVTRKENLIMELESVKRLALIRTLGLAFLFSCVFIVTAALVIGVVLIFRN